MLPNDIFSKQCHKNLLNILEKIIVRYNSKVYNISAGRIEKSYYIGYDEENPKRCEFVILKNYMDCFGQNTKYFKSDNTSNNNKLIILGLYSIHYRYMYSKHKVSNVISKILPLCDPQLIFCRVGNLLFRSQLLICIIERL